MFEEVSVAESLLVFEEVSDEVSSLVFSPVSEELPSDELCELPEVRKEIVQLLKTIATK